MSFDVRASAGRNKTRFDSVSDTPTMKRKNGKIRSVGVQPCHGACNSGQ